MNSTKSPKPMKLAAKESQKESVLNRKGAAKQRKMKAVKDPNAPKKPMTAFLVFSNDKREEIRTKNPELKMPDVAKELGKLWKEITDENKVKYQKIAEADKKRYEEQIKQYRSQQ